MKKSFLGALLVIAPVLAFANNKSTKDVDYYTITSVTSTVKDVPKEQVSNIAIGQRDCSGLDFAQTPSNPLDPVDQAGDYVDKIINIGKKVWALVELGRPKVSLKTDIATALPQGAHCWLDLESWSAPQAKVYNVAMKNAYGLTVINFGYRVEYLTGGSVNGTGKYIGYATMVPTDVYVAWGYNFEANAKVPTVFNMGTKAAPIAGMQMEVAYKVTTVMNDVEGSKAFFIKGDGNFNQLP